MHKSIFPFLISILSHFGCYFKSQSVLSLLLTTFLFQPKLLFLILCLTHHLFLGLPAAVLSKGSRTGRVELMADMCLEKEVSQSLPWPYTLLKEPQNAEGPFFKGMDSQSEVLCVAAWINTSLAVNYDNVFNGDVYIFLLINVNHFCLHKIDTTSSFDRHKEEVEKMVKSTCCIKGNKVKSHTKTLYGPY